MQKRPLGSSIAGLPEDAVVLEQGGYSLLISKDIYKRRLIGAVGELSSLQVCLHVCN
jgi:hypothetical protein